MLLPNLIEIFCAARIYAAGACYIGGMGELSQELNFIFAFMGYRSRGAGVGTTERVRARSRFVTLTLCVRRFRKATHSYVAASYSRRLG